MLTPYPPVWAKFGTHFTVLYMLYVTFLSKLGFFLYTLTWVETYPWWPAVVYGEDDPEVPENVLDLKERPPRGEGPLLCVQFMDKKETW